MCLFLGCEWSGSSDGNCSDEVRVFVSFLVMELGASVARVSNDVPNVHTAVSH